MYCDKCQPRIPELEDTSSDVLAELLAWRPDLVFSVDGPFPPSTAEELLRCPSPSSEEIVEVLVNRDRLDIVELASGHSHGRPDSSVKVDKVLRATVCDFLHLTLDPAADTKGIRGQKAAWSGRHGEKCSLD